MKWGAVLLALLIGAGGAAAFWWWRAPSRRNVLLITVDTLRPDRLSAYGYTKHRTPNFDRLAQEGVLFENAFCDVTWTTPSMASVMTGRYATVHGLRTSYQRLNPDATTLAEVLHAAGKHTAAIVGAFPLDSIFGLNQGFDLYDDTFKLPLFIPSASDTPAEPGPTPPPGGAGEREQMRQLLLDKASHDAYRPDSEVSDRAIRWLGEERREPFFLWLHYFGPHEKPQPTQDIFEQVRLQREQYDPDVVETDRQVGRVLAALEEMGLAGRTVIIVHADHGQSLTEHNYFGHGRLLYDPSQHIPLLMRLPNVLPDGQRVTRLVRNIDILPTVLDLAHIQASLPLDGVSLLPIMTGKDLGGPEEVYAETYMPANRLFADLIGPQNDTALGFRRLAIRTPEWKFIVNDPIPLLDEDHPAPVTPEIRTRYYLEELYDLRADPGESTNVIMAHQNMAAAFLKKLGDYQTPAAPQSEKMELDEASRERLRNLGYLAK